ncbi:ParD-like family protein [Burkholderia sp. FERM BP-3421]|uniref:ParD-like family protein n=1 Tax=Burkholderia sp. FERM BP-3421 TaxID=1494466 RepID=UPI00235EE5BF|nr:ParD-like family protein [Burkholderia sp. FERM BP-3421]WDD92943.1 ParD-like family protein [Burkholderia sp. FERM BP-3421]
MGIVKISEQMHESLRRASGALSRSINAQAEHWLRVGMVAELNPTLSYGEICRVLLDAETGGAALARDDFAKVA